MAFSEFISKFPGLDIPVPDTIVTAKAIASDRGLVVFFTFHEDFFLPDHSHKGQWGTVIEGQIDLTIEGVTKSYGPGDDYDIPSGAVHNVKVKAGTRAIDAFEEHDRYGLKP